MSEKLDFTPAAVPIEVSAGDSVTFSIHLADIDAFTNPLWAAQVRDLEGENPQDFTCTDLVDGVAVYLAPEQVNDLAALAGIEEQNQQLIVYAGRSYKVWEGEYDVEMTYGPDQDRKRTLLRGSFSIMRDVTR